ncbi:ester cyclase [Kribbella capetownensis]|uniref:Ester cyclase n=1 Tax=Kribbella capetownensis TaxID=1572659 RepID=A0A4R0K2C0_9ACTN|nr:ester cyclase [Kribbella capetownensis]TCC53410.1 ester cyclase [Kribbella capetownensis]
MSATTETTKAIFARLHESMNSADPDVVAKTIDELFDPNVELGTPLPIGTTGVEAVKQVWSLLLHAFPDLDVHVEDVIAEGDKLVCRNTVTGTHEGDFMGIAPTGKRISYKEIMIFRVASGRITKTWGVVDTLSQLRQLGAIPTP